MARSKSAADSLVGLSPAAAPALRLPRRLLISSPKGGVGKTALARNLAVAATLDGLRVATIDLDPQMSLTLWTERRPGDVPAIDHRAGTPDEAGPLIDAIEGVDLVVIDTPNALDAHPQAVQDLIERVDFALIPCGASPDDTNSVHFWMLHLKRRDVRCAFVLNRVNRRTRSFLDARAALERAGALCPVEVPLYEDMVAAAGAGVGVMEIRGARGADEIAGVWTFVRKGLGL